MRGVFWAGMAVGSAGFLLMGCLPGPPLLDEPGPPLVLVLRPEGRVPVDASVDIVWSHGLYLRAPPIVRRDGRALSVAAEIRMDGVQLVPAPRWPANATVAVDLSAVAETELSSSDEALQLTFVTAADEAPEIGPEALRVRRPVPASVAPANLRWLLVASVRASTEELRWVSETNEEWVARRADEAWGRDIFELEPRCVSECRPERWRLPDVSPAPEGPVGEILTSSVSDEVGPQLVTLGVYAVPGGLEVEAHFSEVVRVRGHWRMGARTSTLVVDGLPGQWARLRSQEAPPPESTVEVSLMAEDLSGNRIETTTVATMPPVLHIRIQEVVATPRHDWGDSEPNGQPFDAWPGHGTVTSTDEWVELVNHGADILRLEQLGLVLRAEDGSPSLTPVAFAPALRWGDGGSAEAWWPGEALVVRLHGDMAQRSLRLALWAGSVQLDEVWIEPAPLADHPGGAPPDWVHEAISRGVDGRFRWCRPTPGDPLPAVDCVSY